jgi:DNA-binding GntR family transcriptional regulator
VKPLVRSPRDSRPLAVQVYEQLRDLVVTGELSAEFQLVQEQVAEQLGVSRTPVRDALNRLALEGLVTWVPGKGYVVNELTNRDIVEVYRVRLNLELLATELACGHHDAATLTRLQALIEEMEDADPTDAALQFDLNRHFHRTLIEPCENRFLLKMIDTLWDHPVNRRITRSYVRTSANVAVMLKEHKQLLKAATAHDLERLLDVAERHMFTGYKVAVRSSGEPTPDIFA